MLKGTSKFAIVRERAHRRFVVRILSLKLRITKSNKEETLGRACHGLFRGRRLMVLGTPHYFPMLCGLFPPRFWWLLAQQHVWRHHACIHRLNGRNFATQSNSNL